MSMCSVTDIETSKEHIEKWGGYNDAPPGWKKISLKTLVQDTHFLRHTPDLIEHRQITSSKTYIEVQLHYFWDGTGVGISTDYWKGTVQYYRFGCVHDYHELSQEECRTRNIYHAGRCWHVRECSRCKHLDAIDSSD